MTTAVADEVLAKADAALTAVSELASCELSALDESQLLALIRAVEKIRRKSEPLRAAQLPADSGPDRPRPGLRIPNSADPPECPKNTTSSRGLRAALGLSNLADA